MIFRPWFPLAVIRKLAFAEAAPEMAVHRFPESRGRTRKDGPASNLDPPRRYTTPEVQDCNTGTRSSILDS
jgi:hypothetical protein